MIRDEDNDPELSNLLIKTNYSRWFNGLKIPADIRTNKELYWFHKLFNNVTFSQEDAQELKDSLSFTKEEKNFIMSFFMFKVRYNLLDEMNEKHFIILG